MQRSIPLDVLHRIFECLHDDEPTVRSLALANRETLLHARRTVLFRNIKLSTRGKSFLRFSSLLIDSDSIGPLVDSLQINHRTRVFTPQNFAFHKLAHLNTLILVSAAFPSAAAFCRVLECIPSLKSLICVRVQVTHPDINDDTESEEPGRAQQHTSQPTHASNTISKGLKAQPPALTSLVVRKSVNATHESPLSVDVVPAWLAQGESPQSLRTLDLTFETVREHIVWLPLVCAAAPYLHTLHISTMDEPVPEFPTFHASLYDALAECPTLTTLSLTHCPRADVPSSESSDFLKSLCAFLERPAPPVPNLERLTLTMENRYDKMLSVSDSLCTRLARALGAGDSKRYTRFSRLMVNVKAMSWSAVMRPRWYASGFPGKAQKQGMIARWRSAFSAFEEMPYVELDVCLV
ncbi:hypothetical protein C8Q76DRAFT_183148 [Earliella scabrosa]|nr:hypothetical protein C8Q76DRAFT_183148 [Earliella scabrosa]